MQSDKHNANFNFHSIIRIIMISTFSIHRSDEMYLSFCSQSMSLFTPKSEEKKTENEERERARKKKSISNLWWIRKIMLNTWVNDSIHLNAFTSNSFIPFSLFFFFSFSFQNHSVRSLAALSITICTKIASKCSFLYIGAENLPSKSFLFFFHCLELREKKKKLSQLNIIALIISFSKYVFSDKQAISGQKAFIHAVETIILKIKIKITITTDESGAMEFFFLLQCHKFSYFFLFAVVVWCAFSSVSDFRSRRKNVANCVPVPFELSRIKEKKKQNLFLPLFPTCDTNQDEKD